MVDSISQYINSNSRSFSTAVSPVDPERCVIKRSMRKSCQTYACTIAVTLPYHGEFEDLMDIHTTGH